ncbi:aldehyde dehydrogenase family protein [Cnuibacter physcomitrellae]|uniref:aldehyde dehydrogenase family protein n=1 Tax=Cnuibacter physcomitrellae TaxID=1619308 RepID=UPI0021760CEB|nr:aldehyde dehydrogenase family protein [Cnuibacter physcomitrellae]MCS5498324.1 aldehyde dehydrogenase family protein [Cnuibacter physcomitrellae]
MIERDRIFVDGEWTRSSGTGTLTVINPSTEEAYATIPDGGADDVDRAARAAAAALPAWSQTTPAERAEAISRVADILESRADEITRAIVSEVGQPLDQAEFGQTGTAIQDLRITAESVDLVDWDEKVGPTLVHRTAAGVVGAITPWNAPLKMICMKAGAALAAGCTTVLKGTEIAPLSSFFFAEAVAEAGIPDGVFNLVSGTGPSVGEAIVTHPLVDVISLTGSVRAGQRVMELAARDIKRVALELGGKSANIILEDADLEKALVVGMEDAFRNSGQVCGGLTRVLVSRKRLAEAEEIAKATAEAHVIGDPFDPATTLGPVTGAAARERVRGYIQSGIDEGARLMTGGPEAPEGLDRGFFVRPTVFSASNENRIAREEIFGPVITLIPFDDDEDAVRLANDSSYGLAAAIWAADHDRAVSVAKRVRAGRIRINGSPINSRAPHGGFKLSGIGRELGKYGIEEFLEYQAIG